MPTKIQLFDSYKRDLNAIRTNANLSCTEFNKLVEKSLENLANRHKQVSKAHLIFGFTISLLTFLILYVLLNVHQPTSSIVLRNVQGLTYPALKVVRSLSVPIIKLFPSLTNLYDETCLFENPYFYVNDMECWPCENSHSVINLTNINTDFKKFGEGTPFVSKIPQDEVTLESLKNIYNAKVKSNYAKVSTINHLFSNQKVILKDLHIQWRINKMSVTKEIRKLFKRPYFVPQRSGQSVERFIIIDGPIAKSYSLPNTECGNVFMVQGSGERTIVFKPSRECQNYCRTISVILKPAYALSYNWYYWRPISLPTQNSTSPSITYLSSYC